MEMPKWNSLHNYLKQKYFFLKNRGQEGKTGPVWGLVQVGMQRIWGKSIGGWLW
jgi:hypothetical protein